MEADNEQSVLVLDDSEDLLNLTKILVEHYCGRKAITARSFDEIKLRRDEALKCDLAILDINLGPDQPNGVDVYRWLRKNGFTKPIHFLSGHARTFPLVAEAERIGDATVFSKPIPADDLIRIIEGGI